MKLSVCIPTHHGRRDLLREALDSIAGQAHELSGAALEIVVSDNASHDGTDAMVAAFAAEHPAIEVVYGRNDRDVHLANIFRVVERASGDWCWLFGSDDVMAENGLATVERAIGANPEVTGIAISKANFDFTLCERLEGDAPEFDPAPETPTVCNDFRTIVDQLAFRLAYLSTNVVRRERFVAAVKAVADAALRKVPDWPHLVIFGEMARRHPRWAWVPAVLVKSRAGRPYLVERDGEVPNLVRMHVLLVDGLRDSWRQVAAGDRPLYRRLMRRSFWVAGSPRVVHHLRLAPSPGRRWQLKMLLSFTRAFWFCRSSCAGICGCC